MKKIAMIMLLCLVANAVATAQHHSKQKNKNGIEYVVGELSDSTANPYDVLLENIPVDPEYQAPQFAIVDKNNRFYMSLGAKIKAVGAFDWGNPYSSVTDFKPSNSVEAEAGNETSLRMSIKSSSLNFNIVGMPTNKYRVGIFLALTFEGGENYSDYMAKCDYAYIKCNGFTLGYQSNLYDDKSTDAYLIDGNGPGASGSHNDLSISYQRYITPRFKAGVSVAIPKISITARDGEFHTLNQRVPDIPLYVQWSWNEDSHVRLSGVYRTMQYRDFVTNTNRMLPGYGLKLTTSVEMGNVMGYAMAQAGKGIANYMKDNENLWLDMVPSETPGQYTQTKAWGAMCALECNYNPRMFSTFMYGYLRNYVDAYENGAVPFGEHMKYEHYAAANFIWKISKFVNVGLEYNYGLKHDFAGNTIGNSRVSAMMRVGF